MGVARCLWTIHLPTKRVLGGSRAESKDSFAKSTCPTEPTAAGRLASHGRPTGARPADDPRTTQSPNRMSDNPGAVPDRESVTADAWPLAFVHTDVSATSLISDRKRLSAAVDIVRTQGLRTWCVPSWQP